MFGSSWQARFWHWEKSSSDLRLTPEKPESLCSRRLFPTPFSLPKFRLCFVLFFKTLLRALLFYTHVHSPDRMYVRWHRISQNWSYRLLRAARCGVWEPNLGPQQVVLTPAPAPCTGEFHGLDSPLSGQTGLSHIGPEQRQTPQGCADWLTLRTHPRKCSPQQAAKCGP